MRLVISLFVGLTCLAVVGLTAGHAQTPPPPDDELCAAPDPGRAIHLALTDDKLIVAIVEPVGRRDAAAGTPIRVINIVEGALTKAPAIADRQPALACISERAWDAQRTVIGVFMPSDDQLLTLATWPYVDGVVEVGSQRLSVADLLDLGKRFVEPTPTALPPGVAPLPIPKAPDTGTIELPPTGSGGSGSSPLGIWIGLTVLLLAPTVVAGQLLRRRRN